MCSTPKRDPVSRCWKKNTGRQDAWRWLRDQGWKMMQWRDLRAHGQSTDTAGLCLLNTYLSYWVQFHWKKEGRWRQGWWLGLEYIFNFLFPYLLIVLIYNCSGISFKSPHIMIRTLCWRSHLIGEELCYKSMEPHQPDELLFLLQLLIWNTISSYHYKATSRSLSQLLETAEAFLNNCSTLSQTTRSNILARLIKKFWCHSLHLEFCSQQLFYGRWKDKAILKTIIPVETNNAI